MRTVRCLLVANAATAVAALEGQPQTWDAGRHSAVKQHNSVSARWRPSMRLVLCLLVRLGATDAVRPLDHGSPTDHVALWKGSSSGGAFRGKGVMANV